MKLVNYFQCPSNVLNKVVSVWVLEELLKVLDKVLSALALPVANVPNKSMARNFDSLEILLCLTMPCVTHSCYFWAYYKTPFCRLK